MLKNQATVLKQLPSSLMLSWSPVLIVVSDDRTFGSILSNLEFFLAAGTKIIIV
jgi:hypothetical protein